MTITERIDAALVETQEAIARAETRAREEVRTLRQRQQTLQAARALVTPELEAAVLALERVGIQVL